MMSAVVMVYAQQKDLTDSTEFAYGLPISDDDTVRQVRSEDDPRNLWRGLTPSEIPSKLQHTLNSESLFAGWKKSQLYYDERAELYLVRIREKTSVRTYGFNANGKPVTFTEEDLPRQD